MPSVDYLKVNFSYLVNNSNNYEEVFEIKILDKSVKCVKIKYKESGVVKWVRNSDFDSNFAPKFVVIEELQTNPFKSI